MYYAHKWLIFTCFKRRKIQLNDSVEVLKEKDKRLRVAILTLSDKGSQA